MQKTDDGFAPGSPWSSFSHIPAGETKLELAFVEPSMIYEVEMYAENSIGRSTNADLIFVTSPGNIKTVLWWNIILDFAFILMLQGERPSLLVYV